MKIPTNDRFALTLTQKDIYFDQLRHPDSPLYNVGGYIRIDRVDVARLTQAHQALVQGDEAFGIRIHSTKQGVEQSISQARTTHLNELDFSTHEDAENRAKTWLTALFQTPLDHDDQALFKAALLKISETAYWYVGFAHHLMMDGWGFANWAQRLGEIYNDQQLSQQPSQQSNQQNEGDWQAIAVKDQQYIESKKYQSDKHYWLQQPLTTDRLLTPHERLPTQGATSSRAILPLSNEQFGAVCRFAEQYNVGVAHVFLAMLSSYFSTVCSQSNLVFGLPAHNRRNHQQKQMLGVFTSISPMAIEVADEANFVELVQHIGQQQKRNFRHQRYPIGHIINDLQLSGEDSALYDICFNYLKLDSQLSFEGQAADLVYLSHDHEATPLMVTVWEYGEGQPAEIQLDYHFGYFDAAQIKRLCARFSHHLEQLLAQPEQPLKAAEIMPAQEVADLLSLNDDVKGHLQGKAHGDLQEKLIQQLFAEQVAKTPDNVALVFENQQLTYAELDNRSNQLGHYLREKGVVTETLVGISMARSVEMIVAILAILKAGGAYVPLDPNYPQARLDSILADSEVFLLLTDADLLGEFADELAHYSTVPLAIAANQTPANLAYVIYTSGSTGRPKGVAVQHSNTVAMLRWAKATYSAEELSRVLACTSVNFDLSVFELFVPLCFGYQCVLVDSALTLLEQTVEVSLINTVPSAINVLMEQQAIPAGVKVINLAGEPLASAIVNGLLQQRHCEKVCNLYGPSEDTTYSTWAEFTQPISGTPDIGRVIAHSQAYVLSTQQRLLPQGVAGELCLAGAGVARGYLGQDELTAEKFIANPFGPGKLYRTGDLVRYLPGNDKSSDGRLAFLGRIDEQLKIRGFRIEPGEIQSCLSGCEGVASSLVLAREDEPGQPRLVAYLIAKTYTETDINNSELIALCRQTLAAALPDYMMPAAFVMMDSWPLMPNGKVNKKALPIADMTLLSGEYVAPQTETEQNLSVIWAKLLKLPLADISTTASFFALGGHSLLATRVVNEIDQAIEVSLNVKHIFKHNTIQALARVIERVRAQQVVNQLNHNEIQRIEF